MFYLKNLQNYEYNRIFIIYINYRTWYIANQIFQTIKKLYFSMKKVVYLETFDQY